MGDRSVIRIESERFPEPISIYGHWSGRSNLEAVRRVLAKTDRVGDPSYLTAQLFYEFAVQLGGYKGELGFGIGFGFEGDPENEEVIINADTGLIRTE